MRWNISFVFSDVACCCFCLTIFPNFVVFAAAQWDSDFPQSSTFNLYLSGFKSSSVKTSKQNLRAAIQLPLICRNSRMCCKMQAKQEFWSKGEGRSGRRPLLPKRKLNILVDLTLGKSYHSVLTFLHAQKIKCYTFSIQTSLKLISYYVYPWKVGP